MGARRAGQRVAARLILTHGAAEAEARLFMRCRTLARAAEARGEAGGRASFRQRVAWHALGYAARYAPPRGREAAEGVERARLG